MQHRYILLTRVRARIVFCRHWSILLIVFSLVWIYSITTSCLSSCTFCKLLGELDNWSWRDSYLLLSIKKFTLAWFQIFGTCLYGNGGDISFLLSLGRIGRNPENVMVGSSRIEKISRMAPGIKYALNGQLLDK